MGEAAAIVGAALLALGTLAPPRAGLSLQTAGMALLGAVGASVLVSGEAIGAAFRAGPSPALGLDGLSGFFLALLALTAVPTLVYARAYFSSRLQGTLLGTFLLALTLVLTARDITTFLAGWELMTIVPAAAILVARRDPPVRSAVMAYVGITHLGGAGVWLALAMPSAGTFAVAAGLVGFGTKAGLVPLHTWLPRAHPVAPAPFSALMSGLMVKVALYGLIRFVVLPEPEVWVGYALVAAGVLSALGGALWAVIQHDLKRLLAYSTIENVGIAVAALGASVLIEDPRWSALAFAAGLLHIANHAVFKTLLFLGAGAIERATGTLDLDRLGGLARRMPWTAATVGIGCLAIAGLPPLNGFTSEWLTLQALAHLAFENAAGAVALAGIAATAALALLCFVTVAGMVLLGTPRDDAPLADPPGAMRAALVFLAALCVVLGLVPALLVPVLAELAPGAAAPSHPPGFPAPVVAAVLLALTVLLIAARGSRRAEAAPTWACGQTVTPALRYTAAGFTKPLRLVMEALLRPRRSLDVDAGGAVRYARRVDSPADRLLYRPAIRTGLRGAAHARRLQTGNVRTYAAYLLALVLGLLALAQTGALG